MSDRFLMMLIPGLMLLRIMAAAQDVPLTANADALPDAKAIEKYLRSLPSKTDKKLISGQFESWGRAVLPLSNSNNNLTILHEQTGRWAGLAGVEYQEDAGLFPEAPNRLCLEYWRQGGLVQIYLVMKNPAAPAAHNGGGKCDLDLVLDPDHEYHRRFFHELDQVAGALDELQKQGVVVFLNPFAEANAGWFWWGGQNPEKFKSLYRATFDYLVHTRHLNNLLFVFEPSSSQRDAALYYPGSRYVDLIGLSIFVSWDHELAPADLPAYPALTRLGKPLAFSQWGPRRGADQVGKDEPPADNLKLLRGIQNHFPLITWWMNWNMAYAMAAPTNSNFNAKELLEQPRVINLNDLTWKSEPGK